MKYEIRQMSWSKRRKHTIDSRKIKNVVLDGFKKIENTFCGMKVIYENETIELNARVIYNEIQDYWVVAGVNGQGEQCSIKIIED